MIVIQFNDNSDTLNCYNYVATIRKKEREREINEKKRNHQEKIMNFSADKFQQIPIKSFVTRLEELMLNQCQRLFTFKSKIITTIIINDHR